MPTTEDTILLHAIRLDALAEGTARDMRKAIVRLQRDLELILDANPGDTINRSTLEQLVSRLQVVRGGLVAGFVGDVQALLDTTAITGTNALVRGLEAGGLLVPDQKKLVLERTAPFFFRSGGDGDVPYKGRKWQAWAAQAAEDTVKGFGQAVGSFRSADVGTMRDELARQSKRAVTATQTLTATAVTHAANLNRLANLATGLGPGHVAWSSILDGKTSEICRSLSGQVWALSDPDLEPPPRHGRCRSHLVPISEAEFNSRTRDIKRADGGDTATADLLVGRDPNAQLRRKINTDSPYERFLSRQPAKVQREILGPTRLAAWNKGLPLGRMATADRALTNVELRAQYPSFFGDGVVSVPKGQTAPIFATSGPI